MKPIRLRTYGQVDPSGLQIVDYVIYSRATQRSWSISVMLHAYDTEWNASLLKDTFRRLRTGWRDEVLGKGWQKRKAEARWKRESERFERELWKAGVVYEETVPGPTRTWRR